MDFKSRADLDVERGTPVRQKTLRNGAKKNHIVKVDEQKKWSLWRCFARIVTFWAPNIVLKWCGMRDSNVQQAFREKVALCFIILLLCGIVAFLTLGLNMVLCPKGVRNERILLRDARRSVDPQYIWAHGKAYLAKDFQQVFDTVLPTNKDYTNIIPADGILCSKVQKRPFVLPCEREGNCLDKDLLKKLKKARSIAVDWNEINPKSSYLVYNGHVMDMELYLQENTKFLGEEVDELIKDNIGNDATREFLAFDPDQEIISCLIDSFKVANLSREPNGCFAANMILILSLIVILMVVLTRFVMAIAFDWFISHQLDKQKKPSSKSMKQYNKKDGISDSRQLRKQRSSLIPNSEIVNMSLSSSFSRSSFVNTKNMSAEEENDLYSILLVTCYSEGEDSLRTTIESLANTDYHDQRKLLFIVADGLITGNGNAKSTPDLLLDMIDVDSEFSNPKPVSYLAIADGNRQHNMAKVYAGDYHTKGRSVPVILVVKCGTPEESNGPKPGNRGKRDSQLILMNFFQRVLFDDRMCPLDFDIFNKIYYLLGVTPDIFEIVLMVDADTKVAPDSLARMVAAMERDNSIMGLCGETRIANKKESWVTMIQVYEYYISHHLGKAFESVFGGVTCLPGCFCMYRIKAKKNGNWVPILANPEIIEEYSQKTVDTLHKKNLLLLGEDRFLTTLMLKTFPKRKMIFVPQAYCKTVVPNEFKVLLSQRRRWINSTIHNLLELVLVRDLCGIFCFSMQFIILLEIIGTVVLPAALILTFVLIASLFITPGAFLVPLLLLITVLGLPAILILFTTRKLIYIMWMFVYLLALPIWNFVLPVYAYWHFDDFSWGQTRKVAGDSKGGHAQSSGIFDANQVPLKKWNEWMTIINSQ